MDATWTNIRDNWINIEHIYYPKRISVIRLRNRFYPTAYFTCASDLELWAPIDLSVFILVLLFLFDITNHRISLLCSFPNNAKKLYSLTSSSSHFFFGFVEAPSRSTKDTMYVAKCCRICRLHHLLILRELYWQVQFWGLLERALIRDASSFWYDAFRKRTDTWWRDPF